MQQFVACLAASRERPGDVQGKQKPGEETLYAGGPCLENRAEITVSLLDLMATRKP